MPASTVVASPIVPPLAEEPKERPAPVVQALPPSTIEEEVTPIKPPPPPKKEHTAKPKKPPTVVARKPVAPPEKKATAGSSRDQKSNETKAHVNDSLTARAPSLRELPEQVQREIPTIAIGGYIYSEDQRERQLLANRRLLHEGEEAAPGVRLEKMLPNEAVFNYRGYRYRIPYHQ
jgi:general secretion pathway protein B